MQDGPQKTERMVLGGSLDRLRKESGPEEEGEGEGEGGRDITRQRSRVLKKVDLVRTGGEVEVALRLSEKACPGQSAAANSRPCT